MTPIAVCESHAYEDIADLVPLIDNPRRPLTKKEERELDSSILSLGLFRGLLVWRGEDNDEAPRVIGGNQRFKRLKSLVEEGHPLRFQAGGEAPGIPVTDYIGTEAQARLVALRDNNSDGDWDWSSLASFTADLAENLDALGGELSMDLAGFDTDFLNDLSAYGSDDESRVMEAATRDPLPPPPEDKESAKEKKAREQAASASDKDMKIVGVVIGHVRGRLTAPTYRRLIGALAINVDEKTSEGLDAAMSRLLDAAGIEDDE